MNKLEYLNHISQSNRPVQPPKPKFLLKFGTVLKIAVGAIVVLIALMALSTILNAGDRRTANLTRQLYSRIVSVDAMIDQYNSLLKSSQLRSIGYTLASTLTATGNQLDAYLVAQAGENGDPYALDQETYNTEYNMFQGPNSVNVQLYTARLNGLLDRNYTAQLHLQISLLLSLTEELITRSEDPNLTQILDGFYSNINLIEQTLNSYSNKDV